MAPEKTIWAIAEGYIPNGAPPGFISHEAACILSTSDEDAHVQIMLYFTNKEPAEPYNITVGARRTQHSRFNNLTDTSPVPLATNYSSVFVSDRSIVLQYAVLDSRQNANALTSTIAYTE